MKHKLLNTLAALALLALCTGSARGQNIDDLPSLTGAGTDIANDKLLVRDASVTASAGALRKMTIAEMWNALGGTNVSATELGYLDGVTSAIQTQLNAKQATLVSGTSIKTINSTSLLGSGDISVASAWGSITGTLSSQTDLQSALDGKAALPPSIPVFTKACWPYNGNVTTGITSLTCRKRMNAIHNADNIQLVFQNCYAEVNGLSVVTVKAAVEDSAGNIYPAYFNGSRTATVAVNGAFTTSDVVAGLTVIAGREYYVRTMYSWASGNCQTPFIVDNASSPGEGRIDSVDRVDSGSITATTNYGVGPSMVLGKATDRRHHPVIGLLGVSIMAGIPGGPSIGGYQTPYEDNWSVSALGRERGRDYSHIRLAMPGSTANVVLNAASTKRRLFWPYLTHVVCNLGLNDVRDVNSAATIMSDLTAIHKELKTLGVKRIWQTTITPDTSTPGTPGSDEGTRVALNGLIRGVPNPLYGIIDCADAMETDTDSGTWITGYNNDAYHPNNTGGAVLRELMKSQIVPFLH